MELAALARPLRGPQVTSGRADADGRTHQATRRPRERQGGRESERRAKSADAGDVLYAGQRVTRADALPPRRSHG